MNETPRRVTGSGAGDAKGEGCWDLEFSLSASRFQCHPTDDANWQPLGGIIVEVIGGLAEARLAETGR